MKELTLQFQSKAPQVIFSTLPNVRILFVFFHLYSVLCINTCVCVVYRTKASELCLSSCNNHIHEHRTHTFSCVSPQENAIHAEVINLYDSSPFSNIVRAVVLLGQHFCDSVVASIVRVRREYYDYKSIMRVLSIATVVM